MPEKMRCPNCGAGVALDKQGKAICSECGGSFAWQDAKAKLVGVGDFDQVKGEIGTLRESVEAIKKHLGIGETKGAEPGPEPEQDDV